MNDLMQSLTPEQQARLFADLLGLLEKQVKHYHRHYHMGDNTSVPEETAKALMESIRYTLEKVPFPWDNVATALEQGQEILKNQVEEARKRLTLVRATLPEITSDSCHDTLETIGRFLSRYDLQHFAHRTPDFLEYPLLTSAWQDLRGIDRVLCYLNGLWQENQILAGLDPTALEDLYRSLSPDFLGTPTNLCEPPLTNAICLYLLGKSTQGLTLSEADRQALHEKPFCENDLKTALTTICRNWNIRSPAAAEYAALVLPGIIKRRNLHDPLCR